MSRPEKKYLISGFGLFCLGNTGSNLGPEKISLISGSLLYPGYTVMIIIISWRIIIKCWYLLLSVRKKLGKGITLFKIAKGKKKKFFEDSDASCRRKKIREFPG